MRTAVAVALAAVAAAACGDESHATRRAPPKPLACPPVPAYPVLQSLPHYRLNATITARGLVTGTEYVQFHVPRPTGRIVFRLWANAPTTRDGGARLTARVTTKPTGARVVPATDPTMLELALARPLRRNAVAVVEFAFTLRLPRPLGLYRLAYGASGFARLGSWFPLLALDAGGRWATDPPAHTAAETWVSPAAAFDVRLHTPPEWTVVATGYPLGDGRWHADEVRDFAVAAGALQRVSTVAFARKPVLVTAVAADVSTAAAFAHRAARALERLAALYGPYPWPRYNVAVFDDLGASGIEYPNIVFQGSGSLDRATAHEAAHQWFYSLVGNNQARDPWLDESLASWAMTRVDPATRLIATAPIPDAVRGRMTAPMTYWDQVPNEYFAGVYAQGYEAFSRLGPPDRTDCALRLYVARNAFGIARVQDLVNALAARLPPDALRRLAAYG
jgi:Peptidase family M1 domain